MPQYSLFRQADFIGVTDADVPLHKKMDGVQCSEHSLLAHYQGVRVHQKACCQNAEVFIDSQRDLQSVLVFLPLTTSSSGFHLFPNDSLSLSLSHVIFFFPPPFSLLFRSRSNIGGIHTRMLEAHIVCGCITQY